MSVSRRARATEKYKSRLSSEKWGYGPRTGTPMSGVERARRFRKRHKAANACLVSDADSASTSTSVVDPTSTLTVVVPVPMDILNGDTNYRSVEAGTVRLVSNIKSASIATAGITIFFQSSTFKATRCYRRFTIKPSAGCTDTAHFFYIILCASGLRF